VALTTYALLQTAVQDWLSRADLAARVPDFIRLAESRLTRELRCSQMETRSYSTVDLSTAEPEFVTLPTDFQTMRSIKLSAITGKPRLEFLTHQQADDRRYALSDTTGQPVYFAIHGNELELIPTPDLEYELEMIYRAHIPALTDDNTSNWLLDDAPDAYLYGALMEAAPYLEDDKRIGIWAASLANTIKSLNDLTMDQLYNAGPLALRQPGYNP
jgi:hypothetical protein